MPWRPAKTLINRPLRYILLLLVLLPLTVAGQGQSLNRPEGRRGSSIVDDSTRNVYGPKTALWTTESDWFDNRPNYRPLDTAVNNYHRWTYVQRFDYTLQDLGVMGTALNPIYPAMPTNIGANAGFKAYSLYYDSQEPRYYDTKSPVTKMRIVWGGGGRAITEIEFARNINPRWNFGFNYRPILVEKQIQSKGKNDRQTTSHYYDFFTTYRTKNDRYALLFNFRRIRHKVVETGGVNLGDDGTFNDLFDPNASPYLTTAKTEEFRRNIHLSHRYQLDEAMQLYHIADFSDQENAFTDTQGPVSYYDYTQSGSAAANDKASFTSMKQEVGVKGNASKFFYSAYYRFRSYDYSNIYLPGGVNADSVMNPVVKASGTENYLGGRVSLKLDSITEFTGAAEYLLGGFYQIDGRINSPWLEATFKSSLSKPGFMAMAYQGSHDSWRKLLGGINSTEAAGFLKLNTRKVKLLGGGTFTLFSNYVYFRKGAWVDSLNTQTVLPYQSSGIQSTFSPELKGSIEFIRHVFFKPRIIYTTFLKNDDSALRIPELFVNAQLTYEHILFKNHLQMQAGVEFHWHSAYQAPGYDTPTQTYYIQDTYVNPSFPMVDIFLTGKMRRGRFFVKYHNLTQALTKTGYVPTAGYPGTRNLIDFGFDFLLFD